MLINNATQLLDIFLQSLVTTKYFKSVSFQPSCKCFILWFVLLNTKQIYI